MDKLKLAEQALVNDDIPNFRTGDRVNIHYRVREGQKERIQQFEGDVISRQGSGANKTFMVRKISAGNIGVERIFPLYSPFIAQIEVKKEGNVRRSKLYYMRDRSGKSARIKEKDRGIVVDDELSDEAAAAETEETADEKRQTADDGRETPDSQVEEEVEKETEDVGAETDESVEAESTAESDEEVAEVEEGTTDDQDEEATTEKAEPEQAAASTDENEEQEKAEEETVKAEEEETVEADDSDEKKKKKASAEQE